VSNVTNEEAEGAYQVLVVEDEFLIADELRRVLISGGFRVMGPVSSNEDALDLIDQDKPDFAVLDVYLGAETVTPVALELQRLKVPFVLASASSPTSWRPTLSLPTQSTWENRQDRASSLRPFAS